MAIEFGCPGCHETLRVPDTAAGKVAKCPSCSTVTTVPDGSLEARDAAFSGGDSFAQSNPFADTANPYGGESIKSYQVASDPVNPYASPGGFDAKWQGRLGDTQSGNQQITLSAIYNQASALWQERLGLLVGVTLVLMLIGGGMQLISQTLAQQLFTLHGGFGSVLTMVLGFASLVVMTFLGIGEVQICLKICRREPVEFADVFNGGGRFLPVLCAVLLVQIPLGTLSFLTRIACNGIGLNPQDALIAGGWLEGLVSLVFNLLFWPYYYLVVDEKASVLESFGMAYRVTEGNRVTTFVMWLCNILIALVGFLACFVGLVAAVPLIMMMQVVAYLMMSGQMPPEGYPRTQNYKAS